ncbi:sugar ABC transporter substrate-binding protein [Actinoplanes campanulatus]|nr:substrate-binding domain-containing protein [Actinoplanes capillaceus]
MKLKRCGPVAALTVGGLLAVTACSGTTQPADETSTAGSGDAAKKTVVFSALALKIPAMKSLSEGVKAYGGGKGYEILVQDPDLDPQKQLTDLKSVIESGRAGGAWVIAVQPAALSGLVKTAQEKKVPLVLNGVPEDYGLSGMQAGLTFAKIDYAAQGKAIGESLGKCINEKLGGRAKVVLTVSSPGTAGKEEVEKTQLEALRATAPGAEIVTEVTVGERAKAQTDIGNALQGNPDANAVIGNNDEGALGAVGAFAAAGKELPCLAETGGNDEVLQAVKDGKIYASVALQFEADMVQSFDTLTAMIADPTALGKQLATPQKVITKESGQ